MYSPIPYIHVTSSLSNGAWLLWVCHDNGKENRARSYLTDACAGAAGAHKDKITERKPGVRVKGRGTFFPRAYEDGAILQCQMSKRTEDPA